ncbi:hypothetical protein ABEF95_002358 [Exophiala dermatitidis]
MALSHPTELDPLVDRFQHLSGKVRAGEALQMLRKIASMVKPIMRQRNWRVGILTEFYPSEFNLLGLNVNQGEKICLRLRYAGDETQFLPLENIVDTMLHELAHIVYGPHDQYFHALWDKLRDEHEALLRKGYTGEGFLGTGRRLGGRRVPVAEIKRQARAEAEKRRDLTRGSGKKLGGRGILRGQDAREVIAAAVERRVRVERGCANVGDKGRRVAQEQEEEAKREKVTTTKAEQEDENDAALMQAFIDLIQEEESQLYGKDYVPPTQQNPAGTKGALASRDGVPKSIKPQSDSPLDSNALREQQLQIERQLQEARAQVRPQPQKPRQATPDFKATKSRPTTKPRERPSQVAPAQSTKSPSRSTTPETWTCDICTLINPFQHLMCDACGTERPEIYAHQPLSSKSTARSNGTTTHPSHPALQPRLSSGEALAKIESQAKAKTQTRPMGWTCGTCGNWMESEWWTCAACGRMKTSS